MEDLRQDPVFVPLWATLALQRKEERLSQALLFWGSEDKEASDFIALLSQLLVCDKHEACDHCQSCSLAKKGQHPDIHFLLPEKAMTLIKIDQVRALQDWVYCPPHLGQKRVVVIHPIDQMNRAAANALLKILEEPPPYLYFLVLASELGSVLPTILSRLQRWPLPVRLENHDGLIKNESSLSTELEGLVKDFTELLKGRMHPFSLAEKWSKLPFDELLDFLYRLIAALISKRLLSSKVDIHPLLLNLPLLNPLFLYQVLDKLNEAKRYLRAGITLNQPMRLEEILLEFGGLQSP